jgi:hypothetical protein
MKHKSIKSSCRYFIVVFILTMCLPLSAFAVSTVTISSGGDGVFMLQGIGIENAAALDINIQYDTNTLANPQVVQGPLISGAMTAINQSVPGTVRMDIIRITPINGSGVIASLTFDLIGTSPGSIASMNVKLANIKGSPLSALVQISNPQDTANNAAATPQDQNIPSGTATASIPSITPATAPVTNIIPSTVVLAAQPPATLVEGNNKTADVAGAKEQDAQSSVPGNIASVPQGPVAVTQKTEPVVTADSSGISKDIRKTIYAQKSVLDRFKEYKGERTLSAMVSLFENESMLGCRQEPPVSISDGKSIVRVIFVSTPQEHLDSNIAVTGARLLSLKKDADNTNTWIAELMPEKGTFQASLSISEGGVTMIIPLAVSPKVNVRHGRSGSWTDADLKDYLRQKRAGLNKDGKQDYLDDYVFTANYLNAVGQKPDATVGQ